MTIKEMRTTIDTLAAAHSAARENSNSPRETARVYACPCNLRPGGPWSPEMQLPTGSGATWEQLTSATAYCVCGPCAGRYLAYYVAEGVLPQ